MISSARRSSSTQSQVEGVDGKEEIGQAWLLSSKIARKAGHSQTAYSAVLQARQYSTPFTFVQDAKLLYSTGQNLRALQELQNSLNPILGDGTLVKGDLAKVRASAARRATLGAMADLRNPPPRLQAALLKGRWTRDTERFDMNEVIQGFKLAISLDQECVGRSLTSFAGACADSPTRPTSRPQMGVAVLPPRPLLRLGRRRIVRRLASAPRPLPSRG